MAKAGHGALGAKICLELMAIELQDLARRRRGETSLVGSAHANRM